MLEWLLRAWINSIVPFSLEKWNNVIWKTEIFQKGFRISAVYYFIFSFYFILSVHSLLSSFFTCPFYLHLSVYSFSPFLLYNSPNFASFFLSSIDTYMFLQYLIFVMLWQEIIPWPHTRMSLDQLEHLLAMNWKTGARIPMDRRHFIFSIISRQCLPSTQPLTWISTAPFFNIKRPVWNRALAFV